MEFGKLKCFKKDKKGQVPGMGIFITLFAIVGVIFAVFWIASLMGGKGSGLTVQPTDGGDVPTPPKTLGVGDIKFTEDVTVTFSSFSAFSLGTNAGTAHRILQLDGTTSSVVADDSTLEKSPGNKFVVLLGNVTDSTSFTPGTTYYPKLVTGVLPDDGTFTVGTRDAGANYGGQVLSAGKGQITFSFFDEVGTASAVQALGANDADTKMKWRIVANDNVCVGNLDASKQSGKQNLMSYRYNTSVITTLVQLNVEGNDQTAVSTPTGVNTSNGFAVKTYEFPVVCDNAALERSVRIATGATAPEASNDINMTITDINWYVHDDTLEVIAGYEDEDNNDLGVNDYVVGNLRVS